MAQHPIILGQYPGDGKGDPARVAGGKLNMDIAELYALLANTSGLNLIAGPVTKLPPGSNPTFSITGTPPNLTLSMGIVTGDAGAGAPNSADILAIGEKERLERSLVAAGVPDNPSLILDFVRGVHFASRAAIAATLATLIAALPSGSNFSRGSTGTYIDADGLRKTAAAGVPRIDYDPLTKGSPTLLLEGARTNLLLYSNDFTNAAWAKTGLTPTPGSSIGLDGALSMTRMTESALNEVHRMVQSISVTSGTIYTFSAEVREPAGNANKRYAGLLLPSANFGANFRIGVDLVTGAVVASNSPIDAWAINKGNGIWEIGVTAAATATGTGGLAYAYQSNDATALFGAYLGDGTSALEWSETQFEAGVRRSSSIRTTSSTVTRAVETAGLILPAAALNQSEGTLLLEIDAVSSSGTGSTGYADVQITDASSTDRIILRRTASTTANLYAFNSAAGIGGVNPLAFGTPATGRARIAARYKSGSYAGSGNGGVPTGNAAATIPQPIMSRITLTPQSGSITRIARVLYFPVGLSDAKLQALSNLTAWS